MLPTPLVSPEALASDPALLAPVLFLDVRRGPRAAADFDAGHLPGARHLDLDRDLSGDLSDPSRGGRHPLPTLAEWAARLGAWGIRPETPVVTYDDQGGAVAAARAWWMIRAVGHEHVAVLDGGIQAARSAGMPIRSGDSPPSGAAPYPVTGWQRPQVAIDAVGAAGLLLDVRAAERYRGDSEPFDPVAGHIPGAINDPLTNNLGPDGRFLPPAALRARLLAVLGGVEPAGTVVSCGSGVTACHTLLALDVAGLDGAALYVGSWSEWCRSDRPRK